jgi:glycosyltransferase involved in cell wall biosynthesis
LISSPGELLEWFARKEGVEAVSIPIARGIAPFADFLSLLRLCFLLWKLNPDVTEFSTPKAGLLGTLAAWICRVPMRVYMLRGLKLERAIGIKRRLLAMTERLAANCAHVVLCNSVSLREEAVRLRMAPRSKLLLLGKGSSYGVDTDRFCPGCSNVRSRFGIRPDAPVIGFVGRLTCDKGVPELIEAFRAILHAKPDAHLLLVGWFDASEDAIKTGLRRYIERHPRIHYTGFVADTAPYLRAMDLLVLPTWREGFPNAVLEAAATGIPVICTTSTGSRDAVIPEVTGLLIPPGYPEAITEAVLKLLDAPDRREGMGRAARNWVREQYSNEYVLGLIAAFYKNLRVQTTGNAFGYIKA